MPKITELNSIVNVSGTDLLAIVHDPNGAPSTNKIKIVDFANSISQTITANIVFSNTTIITRNYGEPLVLASNGSSVNINTNTDVNWSFDNTGLLNLISTTYGTEIEIGQGMGPTILANGSLYTYSYYTNTETNENWDQGNLVYPGASQIWTEYYGNTSTSDSYRATVLSMNSNYGNYGVNVYIANNTLSQNWNFTIDGNLSIPPTGDIIRNGNSVITLPMLTPKIQYTGVWNGYPFIMNLLKGRAIIYNSNNYILESKTKYWMADRFYTGDSDLSGTETITFSNIGGIDNYFSVGGKGEVILSNIDLDGLDVITQYVNIAYLPSLTSFSANNLAFVGGNFTIHDISNTSTTFNFSNLVHIDGNLYITNNYYLTNYPQFPALQEAGVLNYYYNYSITDYPRFNSLEYCASMFFYNNPGLSSGTQFDELRSTHNIYFNSNVNMANPPTFPELELITGYLEISNNPIMTTAPAFPLLSICDQYINFDNNISMVNGFNFNSIKQIFGDFTAYNCALDQASVDYILNLLASLDGTNGTTMYSYNINLSGGTSSPRSSASDTAYAILISRGCTIYLN